MIVLLRPDAPEEAVHELAESIRALGLELTALDEVRGRAFEVNGEDLGRVLGLRDSPAVLEILTRRAPLVGGEPLWPHFALRLGVLTLLLGAALLLLTAFAPPGLGDPAAPGAVGASDATEWYLQPLGGFLELFPGAARTWGGIAVLVLWCLFLFWPFLDRARTTTPRGKTVALLVRVMGAALIVFVVVLALSYP